MPSLPFSNRLDRYILKTAIVPLTVTLLVAALLLLLEQMLRLLDFVLNENGPIDVVWRMLAFLVPHYLSLALPLSAFLGIVLALRRLSLSSEYDSMLATGISASRILRPLLVLSGFMMLINFLLLAYVQPYARYAYHELRYELQAGLLGARFPVGDFVEVSDDTRLRIGKTANDGTELYDIFVDYQPTSGPSSTFTAESGQFLKSSANEQILILHLENGVQMINREGSPRPGILRFDSQDIAIPLPEVAAFRDRGGEKREATIDELLYIVTQQTALDVPDYHDYQASLHFRVVHTATFLILPFLALGVGITNQRRPSAVGPIFGLALLIVYHEMLEEWAQGVISTNSLSPWLSMWPLYLGFAGISLRLYHLRAHRPGGGGIETLELVVANTINGLKRLTKRFQPEPAE